jgi:tRNA threonylcarbamoyladenosine biosynthesis protein TsaE
MKQNQEATHTILYGVDEIEPVADYLYKLKDTCSIYTFAGSLGAGKTTLVQALLRRFGVTGPIASPTFTYVHTYQGNQDQTIYHFDTYRLPSLNAFIAAGFDEYLYQPNSYAFIEWPEIIEPLLQDRVCRVELEYQDLEKRLMKCTVR